VRKGDIAVVIIWFLPAFDRLMLVRTYSLSPDRGIRRKLVLFLVLSLGLKLLR
jgi:hypothetical protein